MGKSANVQKAEYLLKTMLFDPSKTDQLSDYAWASETSRWNELVIFLASQMCDLQEHDLRELVKYLSDLGHLEVEQLARINMTGDTIDRAGEEASKILGAFGRKGLPEEQALKVLLPLCQMARTLSSDFGGKIQLYLRSYGETMLKDVPERFSLKGIDDAGVRRVFTRWLQKVVNMPVLLQDSVVAEFCEKNGLGVTELVEAADNIDMNVAIVDELLTLETASWRDTPS
jgi:hypothetical protein